MEVKLNNRLANIEILASKGSDYTIKVDDKEYKADIIEVERGGIFNNYKSSIFSMLSLLMVLIRGHLRLTRTIVAMKLK